MVINRGKRTKALNEVIQEKKKIRILRVIESPVLKEVPSSQKFQDHVYEQENPFELKEDNPSHRN